MTAQRLLPLLATLMALAFFTQASSPAEAQNSAPYLTDWHVHDEYGRLRIQPAEFFGTMPTGNAQIVFVAPGIRRVKVTPFWDGSGISVTVATWDMSRDETIDSETITTSGTQSGFLGIAPGGGTQFKISVTKGSQTTRYTKKVLTREANAANADNYLDSMGVTPNVSPNPNARSSLPSQRSPILLVREIPDFSATVPSTPAGRGLQVGGSITLTPLFAPEVPDYSATVLFTPAGRSLQVGGSITLTPPFAPEVPDYSATVPSTSTDTNLQGLGGGSITLTPPFAPEVSEYSATVSYTVSSVTVTPTPAHSKATATVNGNSPSTAVNLEVGENVIAVVVTAESGVQRTYTLTITRQPEVPGSVQNLMLSAEADRVTVTWDAPDSGGAPRNYIVHLKEVGKKRSGETKRPKAKKTSVTFKNLEAGKTYKVWVRANNKGGKGPRVHDTITLPEG